MYSDPRSVRRPAMDRLVTSFGRSIPPSHDRQETSRRQNQADSKWSNDVRGENDHGVKANKVQKGVPKNPKNNVTSTSDGQMIALKNEAHTSKTVHATKLEGVSAAQTPSTKKPEVVSAPASREKSHNKAGKLTVALFLQKLGLSKYLISFQAEEVDMFALAHMTDDDLKSMGLPMGPRKKIVYALGSMKAKKGETKT